MEYRSVLQQKPLKIILVDDSEADYRLAREYLLANKEENYELEWAQSSEDALNKIQEDLYDLCLMDYKLGKTNGLDAAHKLRKNGFRNPIIMLSGYQLTDFESIDNPGEKPFEGFIYKNNMSQQVFKAEIDRLSPRQKIPDEAPVGSIETIKELDEKPAKASKKKRNVTSFDEKTVSTLIVENLPDPIMLMDSSGNIVMINKVFAELMGMSTDEILGVNACLFMDCSKERLLDKIGGPSRFDLKTRVRKKSLQGRFIFWKIAPVNNGNAPGVRALAQGSVGGGYKRRSDDKKGVGLLGWIKILLSGQSYVKYGDDVSYNRRIFF